MRMKRIIFVVINLAVFAVLSLPARDGTEGYPKTFGIGVILGEPTGVASKLWLHERVSLDVAGAWSFMSGSFYVHGDIQWHMFDLIAVETGRLPLFVGAGARIKFTDTIDVGVRFPLGLVYIFATAPVDIFVEVAPALVLVPATEFDIGAGIGVRFYPF